jgi:SET domain-containing protein 6
MDQFQTTTNRFLEWFKSVGGEFRDDLLEIKDFRASDAGRGIGKPRIYTRTCNLIDSNHH